MDSTPDPAVQQPRADDSVTGVESTPAAEAAVVTVGQVDQAPTSERAPALGKWLVIYSLLRIGLLVVLAAGLSLLMPLILALLFAIVLALPLSWVLFSGARRRVNAAMAVSTAHRRAERERLRSALNGQDQQ